MIDGPTLCPFALVTGLACPLCGMTRAFIHLVRGDFGDAVAYHPLVLLIVALVIAVAIVRTTGRRWPSFARGLPAVIGLSAVFVVTWVLRLATGTLPPV